MNVSKRTLGITVGAVGTIMIAYYLYRRKYPSKKRALKGNSPRKFAMHIPNLIEHDETHKYILQQMQLGENCLAAGDMENGVEHLGNAVVSCNEPIGLIQVLKETLQTQVFQLLLTRLEHAAPHKLQSYKR